MYEVIKDFTDLEDNNHVYRARDPFPRDGVAVSKERIEELASTNNKRNEVLIKSLEDNQNPPDHDENGGRKENQEFPKHTGGGYFELSNGEKVQGKDAAIEAEEALHE
ncbi:hypothetical protein [Ornithinibacillus bavariensis]|uniref:hypothetical protein n=1 Tax=Ornithinibacillus bavariensis TaxID=545502 RepID=UPI003D1FCAA3